MGLTQLNFDGKNKIEVAIMRLKEFEPPEGYYLAFSGGKDSVVIYDLAVKAGVKFDAHYSQGGIDPPELVYFIRDKYPNVSRERPEMTVWEGIQKFSMPRRQARWCCELIKEQHGSGRRVITGIRRQESSARAKRPMFQFCAKSDKTKSFLNPIIDWTARDVWDYIKINNLPYCKLYDEGFKRLGCVLCPMHTPKQTQMELKRFPKLADCWKRACYRLWETSTQPGIKKRWDSPEAMWQWWLSRKGEPKVNYAQCVMFDN